jgi:hypothetical protein
MDVTNPLPFIGLAPCRIVDTRGNGAPIQGGIFTGGSDVRNYVLAGICGIPASARSVSLNFTVTGPGQTAPGYLTAWPTGGAVPLVSILNWSQVPMQIANAAVVPTSATTSITVNVSAPTHVIVDVNGYYYDGASGVALGSGEQLKLIGNIFGSTATFQNQSASPASSGVLGFASATTGTTYGVLGLGVSGSTGAAGVRGLQEGTSGGTYGVQGVTFSTASGSAGVYGVDGSGDPWPPGTPVSSTGLRGASKSAYGVLGISGGVAAIHGISVDSTGSEISAGSLGYGTIGVKFDNGLSGTGTKSFVEPHPTDASKVIRYVSIEGREAGTYFRGRGRFQRGLATIEPPEDFRMVTDPQSLSVQVTPIGEMASFAVVRIGLDGIVVKGSRDVEFFYLVNGVRRAYNHWDPIQENQTFFVPESPQAKLPKYLSEEETGRLIANGTYNADGTVNMETAERLGWAKAWRDREEQAKAAAAAKAAAHRAALTERK